MTAQKASEEIGFIPPRFNENLDFHDLFGFESPNQLQENAGKIINGPGIYIVEAPMGQGKTEAALLAAYNLLCSGKATGIYFALPTQATSNRIHFRVADFVNRICVDSRRTNLIHGNSWLLGNLSMPKAQLEAPDNEGSGDVILRDWFASKKRALLAPFGVGTVDQALLGVVAARHFFVRRFAMAGKVVVIDEVHSYDVYTGTLVRVLCEELEKLGCTVILLSATLTKERIIKLLGTSEVTGAQDAYPLLTAKPYRQNSAHGHAISFLQQKTMSKKITISFGTAGEALDEAVKVAANGGCVLWICNTVAQAQKSFGLLLDGFPGSIQIGLLHSRFPFFKRDQLENYWMAVFGKDGGKRKGCILVSTQIVEQSVDLDADLMISELAPTDMLLQRLGRLWRHDRKKRPISSPKFIIIKEEYGLEEFRSMAVEEIKDALGGKAFVYSPYVLLRSLEIWTNRSFLSLPEDIRPMVASTYQVQSDDSPEPESWTKLSGECLGDDYAKKMIAERETNIFEKLLDDIEGVNTRLNDRPTVSMVLCKSFKKGRCVLLDDSRIITQPEHFDITLARTLNRNLVKVPRNAVTEQNCKLKTVPLLERYVQGEVIWGVIDEGIVSVPGMITPKMLKYTHESGVAITKRGGK